MRAVRLFGPGDIRCVEIPKPVIERDTEIIVKVKSCGVCGSDLERVMTKGAYRHPLTIGHEFSGEVVAKGEINNGVKIGDRVAVYPLVPCGKCSFCLTGNYVLCDDYLYYGSRIDGAMAEYVKVNDANLVKIPPGVDYESASMVDPASVALHALRKTQYEPGQSAIIFGLGPIGLFALQLLKILGCRLIYAVDIYDEKLKLAKKLGVSEGINGRREDVKGAVTKLTAGEGVDVALDFAGSAVTQLQAIQSVCKNGRIVFCGISYTDLVLPNLELGKILRGELTIKGAWNSLFVPLPVNEWEICLNYMKDRKLQAQPLVSHRFTLEECVQCFEMMYNRTELYNKVLFKPEG